jgi:hypothetical protein
MERPTASSQNPASSSTPAADAIEQRIVALAEQLGRLVGTVQAKADGFIDRPALQEQLTRIRDGAAGLLGSLGSDPTSSGTPSAPRARSPQSGAKAKRKKAAGAATQGRSGGKVDAPGKKHRKPAARTGSVKQSDQTIPKLKMATQVRRSSRSKR